MREDRLGDSVAGAIVDLRDEGEPRAEALSECAQEAKILIIWDQDGEAREILEAQGLAEVAPTVAALAVRAELERNHTENARLIAARHGLSFAPIARDVAEQLTREGFGDRGKELSALAESTREPLKSAEPAPSEPGRETPSLSLSAQDERRAAAIACEHHLRAGRAEQAVALVQRFELVDELKDHFAEAIESLLKVPGGHEPVFDERCAQDAAILARGAGLEPLFLARAQEIAARALVQVTIRRDRAQVSAIDFAWRYCNLDEVALRELAPVGLLLCAAPPGFHEPVIERARARGDLAFEGAAVGALEALNRYLERERSPRALAELATLARSFDLGKLAKTAAERAVARYLAIKDELEPAEAAQELESALALVQSFELGETMTRKLATACARLWLPVDPGRAAELAREHGLDALMREAASRLLRCHLEARELDAAEQTTQRFNLLRDRVIEVAREVVEAKARSGQVLDALAISRVFGAGGDQALEAAHEVVAQVVEGDGRHEELERALAVAVAAGLEGPRKELARRLFRQRYQFSRLVPGYTFLLEALRFAVAQGIVELVGADFEEGLVRVLAFHAQKGSLERFDELIHELRLQSRLGGVVEAYLARITKEQAPWHLAVERVARRYDRSDWLAGQAEPVVENALIHGDFEEAQRLALALDNERLQTIVERSAALVVAG